MIALLLLACAGPFPTATIQVAEHPVKVEVAHTHELRQRGLMHRDSLGEDRGMLFVYPEEAPRSFWMKNTRIPLDIAFVRTDGTIVRIAQMKPLDTETTPSLYPARYALEMNVGWFEAHGVEKGDVVSGIPDITPE